MSFGSGAMTNSIEEIADTKCIFAIGTNTTEDHPVIALQIKKAVDKGAKLIVADPRQIPLCRMAHIWLRHRPGTDVALLMGMCRVILDEGLVNKAFVEQRCENFEEFKNSLKGFNLDLVSEITGVPATAIAEAARVYATSDPASILYAMGITQHSHGTDNVLAVANLAMLTGNVGKWASGVNPLRGQNNVQGSCDMGALPNVFTAYQPVSAASARSKFEAAWGCTLPTEPGLMLTDMFPAMEEGKIKAVYIIGENPVLSDPDAKHIKEALSKLEFLVVQDIFLTETAQLAHVVLPGTSFAERDGTFTNTERRVQRVRKAVAPPGSAKPDWQIVCEIARRMRSKGFEFTSAADIMKEIADLTLPSRVDEVNADIESMIQYLRCLRSRNVSKWETSETYGGNLKACFSKTTSPQISSSHSVVKARKSLAHFLKSFTLEPVVYATGSLPSLAKIRVGTMLTGITRQLINATLTREFTSPDAG